MASGQTVFWQLLQFLPRHEFGITEAACVRIEVWALREIKGIVASVCQHFEIDADAQ